MGMLEDIGNKLKNEATYRISSEASNAISKGAEKLLKKENKGDKCPKCGAQIASGLKFCSKCGAKLTVTCKKCKVDYPVNEKFCAQCGKKL